MTMLHDEIREARIRAGLSQNRLAQLAKVPRSQLRKLEEGGNVTLTTVEKVLAQLPDVELAVVRTNANPNRAALQKAVTGLIAAAQRVMDVLQGKTPEMTELERMTREMIAAANAAADRERDQERDHGPVGATRAEPEPDVISPELRDKLVGIIEEIKAMNRAKGEH